MIEYNSFHRRLIINNPYSTHDKTQILAEEKQFFLL